MHSNAIVVATVVAGAGWGALVDLRTRRVPNALTGSLALAGVTLAASGMTGVSVWSSLAGLALGLALMLPGHVIGATGAGDVKLFAAAGAVMGAGQVLPAFLYCDVGRRCHRPGCRGSAAPVETHAGDGSQPDCDPRGQRRRNRRVATQTTDLHMRPRLRSALRSRRSAFKRGNQCRR